MGKEIKFKVINDIYWDDWGRFRRVFSKNNICDGIMHSNGTITAESMYHPGVVDYIDLKDIEIIE